VKASKLTSVYLIKSYYYTILIQLHVMSAVDELSEILTQYFDIGSGAGFIKRVEQWRVTLKRRTIKMLLNSERP
jgi:hypothetical protein